MVELKRTIRCTNCNTEVSFSLSTDLGITELVLTGRCQRCGNSLQINFNIIGEEQKNQFTASTPTTNEQSMVNVDESLFEQEIPSDVIRDLMEE